MEVDLIIVAAVAAALTEYIKKFTSLSGNNLALAGIVASALVFALWQASEQFPSAAPILNLIKNVLVTISIPGGIGVVHSALKKTR